MTREETSKQWQELVYNALPTQFTRKQANRISKKKGRGKSWLSDWIDIMIDGKRLKRVEHGIYKKI